MNPLGRMVNNYLMKMALPLGIWFIIEYLLRNAAARNVLLSFITTPMMIVTPVALWFIIRQLRRQFLDNRIAGFQAWTFGTQLMFFAGLIEALFIYIYNEFLYPGNLAEVQQAMIAQYEEAAASLRSLGSLPSILQPMQEAVDALREAPVASPIETAISQLSTDIFYGMLLMIPIALIVRKKGEKQETEEFEG